MSQATEMSTRDTHTYILCGWRTHSDIPLTLVPASVHADESVDVLIQLAPGRSPIAENARGGVCAHSPERSLIRVEGVADFEISRGRQIYVWPNARATQKDVEIFLFGAAWATLCHQRGLLPLHASAVLNEGEIAAFAGPSGVGKSTIAALLGSLDYKFVSDDILPVSFNERLVPGAWPYLQRLKLRDDSINELALTPTEPVSEILDKEKYFVRPKCASDDTWNRLERLYLLEIDPTDSCYAIDRITGLEAVHALIDQTYHFHFIRDSGRFGEHLSFCTQLASKIAIYRLRRPPSFGVGKELRSIICAHLKHSRNGCNNAL